MTALKRTKEERNEQIYNRRLEGLTYAALAREFGLTHSTITYICQHMERVHKYRKEKGLI